jgi:hypothetical protein
MCDDRASIQAGPANVASEREHRIADNQTNEGCEKSAHAFPYAASGSRCGFDSITPHMATVDIRGSSRSPPYPLKLDIRQDSEGIHAVLTGAAGMYVELHKAALTGFLQALRDPLTDLEIQDELRMFWSTDDDQHNLCHIVLMHPITGIEATWYLARRTGQDVAKQIEDEIKALARVRKRR